MVADSLKANADGFCYTPVLSNRKAVSVNLTEYSIPTDTPLLLSDLYTLS